MRKTDAQSRVQRHKHAISLGTYGHSSMCVPEFVTCTNARSFRVEFHNNAAVVIFIAVVFSIVCHVRKLLLLNRFAHKPL